MRKIYSEILGEYVELPDKPSRIISLAPSITETLYLLGLEQRIVAVSHFCNKPREAKQKPRIGSYFQVNMKKLEELDPDLVLVTTGAQRKLALELHSKGYKVYPVPLPTSIYGIIDNTITIGYVTNTIDPARKLARQLARKATLLEGQVKNNPRIYYEIWLGGPVTIGAYSYITDALNHIGAKTCFEDHEQPWIINPDPDQIKQCNPGIILYEIPPYSENTIKLIEKSILERGLDKNKILALPPDSLAHYGPDLFNILEDIVLALNGKTPIRTQIIPFEELLENKTT
ncbi:MAG: helical backbone metal receptor [Desulfurococcales archaeon]|nr:helical backbone metal receptor [Desulfurococcales archaeon]